tara:strand:+ start:268 stop:552 length:285 start_codon:yes stop_codon:yes gene_type:complete
MTYMEMAIIALVGLNLLFAIWQTRIIGLSFAKLDSNIAQALPLVLKEAIQELNIDSIETVNPIMKVIAESIGKSISPNNIEVTEISRSGDGKFK